MAKFDTRNIDVKTGKPKVAPKVQPKAPTSTVKGPTKIVVGPNAGLKNVPKPVAKPVAKQVSKASSGAVIREMITSKNKREKASGA